MRLPTLSRREKFESASLLLVGLVLVAVAIQLHFSFASDIADYALVFWLVGFILIGAGVLCRFRRVLSGLLIGSIVFGYLSVSKIDSDGINANTTFLELAEEIDATDAESDEQLKDASATPSQQSRPN